MSRDRLDGRLVTRCDACGNEIEDGEFVGVPGLTEFLGIGICARCREDGEADVVDVLLGSGLLSPAGERAVRDWQILQAPEHVRDLILLTRGDKGAIDRYLDGSEN
jgi:hypothetical protein